MTGAAIKERSTPFAWLVFALVVGLMLSDYMSRQVLGAVFPQIKADWRLTDEQLGRLTSVVPLMVGLLTFPLSLLADRIGRVRALTAMALLWSAATLICALAQNYTHLFAARALIGLGEAAYGSVGLALVLGLFPARMRASVTATFMAGGVGGSVLGVGIGGTVAAAHGWRWAFAAIAGFGIVLALAFAVLVRESRIPKGEAKKAARIRDVFASRRLVLVYVGSGLQLFMSAVTISWLPSWFNRVHDLPPGKAAQLAALVLMAQGAGMIFWGVISDRLAQGNDTRRFRMCIALGAGSGTMLGIAFFLPPSLLQWIALFAGVFMVAGTTGPVGAIVARLTPAALHGTAFAVLTLANNAFGLAPGPWLTGVLADRIGLGSALAVLSVVPLAAALCFAVAGRERGVGGRAVAVGT
jgi:predicted MFS family arabinose efflux permease